MAESLVWAFVIERGLDTGEELRLFWSRTDAQAAASERLADIWADDGSLPADVDEAIEQYNELLSGTEHTFVGQFPVEGERPRCDLAVSRSVSLTRLMRIAGSIRRMPTMLETTRRNTRRPQEVRTDVQTSPHSLLHNPSDIGSI